MFFNTSVCSRFNRRIGGLMCATAVCSARRSSSKSRAEMVGYCTDVEGDYEYWNRYVNISRVLSRDSETQRLKLRENAHFVFGGDAVDWGVGDLRFVSELVELYEEYPGRVHIVLGNRDINKLRLLQELRPRHIETHPLKRLSQPYWTRRSGKTPYEQCSADDPDNVSTRLRWILQFTMGAPKAFEYRREELSLMSEEQNISDTDVVKSFLKEISRGGSLRKLLEFGKLGVIMGNTLFVHGGVHKVNYGWLPNSNDVRCTNARTWIERLNEFKSTQMRGWDLFEREVEENDDIDVWSTGGGYTNRFGEDLLMYGMRMSPGGKRVNPGVVYADYILEDDSGPRTIDSDVVTFLNRSGIRRVVVGHRPHGDSALVIRQKDLSVITMDTSYASFVHGVDVIKTGSRRGVAVSELVLCLKEENEYDAVVHGILADGTKYELCPERDDLVGQKRSDGWYVKSERVENRKVLWSRMTKPEGAIHSVIENKYVDEPHNSKL